ncbi:MAG: spore cortex biosynthesis protein YabQ, partial [Clostridia bacterium]
IPLVFVKKGKKAVKILCDINYAVFLIIVMPQLFLIFNNGGADLYCFLGLIIGFILYYKFIKFPLDRVVEKLYNRIISGNFLTQKQKDKIDK